MSFILILQLYRNVLADIATNRFPSGIKSEPTLDQSKIKRRRIKSDDNTKNLRCHLCDKSFTTSMGLKLHSQHHTGNYSFFCDQCRKGFVAKSNYEIHMRAHEGRGYPCEYCSKKYSSRQNLQYHMSEHTGKYRFTCEICEKGFNEKILFVKHGEDHEM